MSDRSLTKEEIKGCGAGKGADCCLYISAGKDGILCERGTAFGDVLKWRRHQMVAQRDPTEPRPECQIFREIN